MVEIPSKIERIIKDFIEYLEKSNIHINKAILFGSYSMGNYNEWSDIDLALVSDNFSGVMFNDLDLFKEAKRKISLDISPMPFRPEDFTTANLFVK